MDYGEYKVPLKDYGGVHMEPRQKRGAQHELFEQRREYVLEPSEVEYGRKVGFIPKLWYYLKWTAYTLLWMGTFGHVKKAP